MGIEVASTGVQVHGGMGFDEETGAAQHYRDARILAIYEGTNGIQSIDLVMRKLPLSGGETVKAAIARYRAAPKPWRSSTTRLRQGRPAPARGGRFAGARDRLDAVDHERLAPPTRSAAPRPITPLRPSPPAARSFAEAALASHAALQAGESDPAHGRRIRDCRFFAENTASGAAGLEHAVIDGAASVNGAFLDAAE